MANGEWGPKSESALRWGGLRRVNHFAEAGFGSEHSFLERLRDGVAGGRIGDDVAHCGSGEADALVVGFVNPRRRFRPFAVAIRAGQEGVQGFGCILLQCIASIAAKPRQRDSACDPGGVRRPDLGDICSTPGSVRAKQPLLKRFESNHHCKTGLPEERSGSMQGVCRSKRPSID